MKFNTLFKAIDHVNKMKNIYHQVIFINKDNQNKYYITYKMSKETVYTLHIQNQLTTKQIRKEKVKKILKNVENM